MLLKDIADKLGAELHGDGNIEIRAVANLKTARPDEISFLSDPKYREVLSQSEAGAVILKKSDAEHAKGSALILDDPYVGFAKVARLLDTTPDVCGDVYPSAVVDPTAKIGEDVSFGPGVHIQKGAVIGNHVQLAANVVVGPNAKIGDYTKVYSNVSIYHDCEVGSHCLIQSGAVIGSDGFGYANERGEWIKIPQTGRVIVGNRVEIGACTCIDRGAIDDTVIADNVIIDNLCQIAHNVKIGYGTAMAGQTTVAGSVTIGKYCIIGGTSIINGHIEICDGVTLTGNTVVMRSIEQPGIYSSSIPCTTNKEWRRNTTRYLHINDMYHKIATLEAQVKKLTEQLEK